MKISVIFLVLSIYIDQSSQDFQFINNSPFKNTIQRKFIHSVNLIDCGERIPILFYYTVKMGSASFIKYSHLEFDVQFDPLIREDCQQTSTLPYSTIYNRGYMTPINIVDQEPQSLIEANYTTNFLPIHKTLNRGAWTLTDEFIECQRDIYDLEIIGGIIMGNNSDNDLFLETHGIRTPDFLWKIFRNLETDDVIAWIMPNNKSSYRSIDQYLTSVNNIEQQSGFYFPSIGDERRFKTETNFEDFLIACNRGIYL